MDEESRDQSSGQCCALLSRYRLEFVAGLYRPSRRDETQQRQHGAAGKNRARRETGDQADREEGSEKSKCRQRQRHLAAADLAQYLPAVETPHRNQIGQVEDRHEGGKHRRDGSGVAHAGGTRCLARKHCRRHQQGREAGAHKRHEGNLEAAVIRSPADRHPAEDRNEDHPHTPVPHHPKGGEMTELVQCHRCGQTGR